MIEEPSKPPELLQEIKQLLAYIEDVRRLRKDYKIKEHTLIIFGNQAFESVVFTSGETFVYKLNGAELTWYRWQNTQGENSWNK